METLTCHGAAGVVGWRWNELRAEIGSHGDKVVRRTAVGLAAAVAIVGALASQQRTRIGILAAQVRQHRHVAKTQSLALDALERRHEELIAATSDVPLQRGGAWGHRFVVTQYIPRSPEYGPFNDGYTATMVKADPAARIVAVDPKLIPYGSRVWIEGLGWYHAQDCGSAIKGHRLDVLTATTRQAFAFGRQERFVIVLPPDAA